MAKHKCFISYHHDDQVEVDAFVKKFAEDGQVFIRRGVGIMEDDVINSDDKNYIMRRIREKYLTDSTVTIVLIGKCTWARRYVDWEIASTLRNDSNNKRSGLLAITLPSVANSSSKKLPARLDDNVDDDKKYARWYKYPTSKDSLTNMIEEAFQARDSKSDKIDNTRDLRKNNASCS